MLKEKLDFVDLDHQLKI